MFSMAKFPFFAMRSNISNASFLNPIADLPKKKSLPLHQAMHVEIRDLSFKNPNSDELSVYIESTLRSKARLNHDYPLL